MVYKMTLPDLIKASERRRSLLRTLAARRFQEHINSTDSHYNIGRADECERFTEILRRLSDD